MLELRQIKCAKGLLMEGGLPFPKIEPVSDGEEDDESFRRYGLNIPDPVFSRISGDVNIPDNLSTSAPTYPDRTPPRTYSWDDNFISPMCNGAYGFEAPPTSNEPNFFRYRRPDHRLTYQRSFEDDKAGRSDYHINCHLPPTMPSRQYSHSNSLDNFNSVDDLSKQVLPSHEDLLPRGVFAQEYTNSSPGRTQATAKSEKLAVDVTETLLLSSSLTDAPPGFSFDDVIKLMEKSFKDLAPILIRPDSVLPVTRECTLSEMWDSQMSKFAHDACSALKFAKKIPGFRSFPIEEQMQLVQKCMFPIVIVMLALVYDPEKQVVNWFGFLPEEQEIILECFETFRVLVPILHRLGQVVREIDLDETEAAFLCALFLMDSANQSKYKSLLLDALAELCRRKYGLDGRRFGRILICLRILADADQLHHEALQSFMRSEKFSSLEIPQLYKESFTLGSDSE